MNKLIFAVLWSVIVVSSAFPAIINVPGEVSSIQGAINGALDGDTVLVAPGIYYENINFLGKGILVASNFIFNGDTATISATIIDGGDPANPDSGSVVYFISGEDSTAVITGFTIRNGTGTPVETWRGGGGVYVDSSCATISSNIIEGNTANDGAGVFCYGSSCRILNNTIIGNSAHEGGGIVYYNCPSVLISDNIITRDTVLASGGGILGYRSYAIMRDNSIIETVSLMTGPSYGGGISCGFCSGAIEGNYISGNTAEYGGGIFSNFCTFDIIGNFVHQNSIFGAISSWMDSSTSIENNILSDNDLTGIHVWEGLGVTIVNNTIYGGWDAGIKLSAETPFSHISNNMISNVLDGWGIRWGTASGWTIGYNDFWNNSRGTFSDYRDGLADTTWGENLNGIPCDSFYNIFRDPMFTDPQAGDFHLSSNSPCIDAGNNFALNLPSTDFDGSPRIVDGNEDDSAVVDMGAFEYHLDRGDVNQDGVINIADVIYLVNYLFIGGLAPSPLWIGDVNCDSAVDIGDVIYLINYLFCSGAAPC
jgi:parallel beta-helix repeat protein